MRSRIRRTCRSGVWSRSTTSTGCSRQTRITASGPGPRTNCGSRATTRSYGRAVPDDHSDSYPRPRRDRLCQSLSALQPVQGAGDGLARSREVRLRHLHSQRAVLLPQWRYERLPVLVPGGRLPVPGAARPRRPPIRAMKPGVTVVVPFHAARRTSGLLDRAIRTVHAQTVPVHLQLAEDIHHKGAPATRQAGLDLVDTEWTAFLDSDDELDPDHIEQLLACAKDTGADYVYPWFRVKGGT